MIRKIALFAAAFAAVSISGARAAEAPEWSMKATTIEACSCPQFCQCYFNATPASHAGHGEHHEHAEAYCRFNNAYKVDKGNYGKTSLDGAKFWIAGDLGHDLASHNFEWAVLTFDPSVTKEQREGLTEIVQHIFPVKWASFTTGKDAAIEWKGGKDRAEARLDGGKAGEVVLKRDAGAKDDEPIVIQNLRYWGAPRNEGFRLMSDEIETYRLGEKSFEFKGTSGFMLTFDINSKDGMKGH